MIGKRIVIGFVLVKLYFKKRPGCFGAFWFLGYLLLHAYGILSMMKPAFVATDITSLTRLGIVQVRAITVSICCHMPTAFFP